LQVSFYISKLTVIFYKNHVNKYEITIKPKTILTRFTNISNKGEKVK